MRNFQREIIRDLNKQANQPCTCANNGDYCARCNARLDLAELSEGMSLACVLRKRIQEKRAAESTAAIEDAIGLLRESAVKTDIDSPAWAKLLSAGKYLMRAV